ncbi:hypothetical protein B0H13DRAFT_2394877 [Mycena leptocephala]|nr:hypothetical protein B0H13DRAFT_2394877 [Mycena leptocephala]
MVHVPPELAELIIHHAWGCLSSSSHQHAYSMATWMLVSRDWLKVVLSIVFRDLWITSFAHIKYIVRICAPPNTSFICELAGITDVRRYLIQPCRSLTISVYHSYDGEYAAQCTDLIEDATTDPRRGCLLPVPYKRTLVFPFSLIELHVTFAYTSPLPRLLLDAPRGTVYPPPWPHAEMPRRCRFDGVRRLVVRDTNADFVAFLLTTTCPRLERVGSTAEFCLKDVPQSVSEDVKAKLAFVRLPRTTTWPA